MFNLDQAITDWRRQIATGGIKSPKVLDELESHLREEVEQQIRLGTKPPQAFEIASARIGQADVLSLEFAMVNEPPVILQKLMGLVGAILVSFILVMSGFTFSFIEFSLGEQIVAYAAVTLSLLVACRWRQAVPFLPVLPNPGKRMTLGFLFIVSGFVCSSLFAQIILPNFERNRDGQIPAIGFWLLFPIAVGFGLAGGIQEAASAQTARARSGAIPRSPA
jgi:hypothetical protein